MGINLTVGEVRASYANIWTPKEYDDGGLKFSLCALLPKTNKKMIKAVEAAIDARI